MLPSESNLFQKITTDRAVPKKPLFKDVKERFSQSVCERVALTYDNLIL